MLVHHVLFWLKSDTTPEQKGVFRKSLEALKDVETVKAFHVGVPSTIERAVVDTSYTFSLVIFFGVILARYSANMYFKNTDLSFEVNSSSGNSTFPAPQAHSKT